jgi:DNA-binding NtrC family response regulator
MGKQDTTVRIEGSDAIGRGPEVFWIVAISEGSVQTHLVPEVGTVRIGRADHNELAIDHPTISREHAAIHHAEGLELEDLGSANGTRLRGSAIAPHRPVPIAPGEVIDLGAISVLVVGSAEPLRVGRLWSNRYFEMRLEKRLEHARRDRGTARLSVLRVHVADPFPAGAVEDVIEGSAGAKDVASVDAHGEYAILLDGSDRDAVLALAQRIDRTLSSLPGKAQIGVAAFPEDGLTKDALLEAAQSRALGASLGAPDDDPVVASRAIREVLDLVDRAARGTLSVLLLGETGVGKEVVAHRVHAASPRANRPFVAVNCAALTEPLLERELFGADQAKPGLLASAHGGTMFLDEVRELPPSTQAKLLRVIEERQIDVRFLSATNRALEADAESGAFRRDLLYRLNGFTITIPPLRERVEEIEPLAVRFAERVSEELGRDPPSIAEDALEILERYRWPGNIRELKNVVERAVLLLSPGEDQIGAKHLPSEKLSSALVDAALGPSAGGLLPTRNADAPEAIELARVLDDCAGNQTRAAERLGIARRTLMKRLDKYGFKRPRRKT